MFSLDVLFLKPCKHSVNVNLSTLTWWGMRASFKCKHLMSQGWRQLSTSRVPPWGIQVIIAVWCCHPNVFIGMRKPSMEIMQYYLKSKVSVSNVKCKRGIRNVFVEVIQRFPPLKYSNIFLETVKFMLWLTYQLCSAGTLFLEVIVPFGFISLISVLVFCLWYIKNQGQMIGDKLKSSNLELRCCFSFSTSKYC